MPWTWRYRCFHVNTLTYVYSHHQEYCWRWRGGLLPGPSPQSTSSSSPARGRHTAKVLVTFLRCQAVSKITIPWLPTHIQQPGLSWSKFRWYLAHLREKNIPHSETFLSLQIQCDYCDSLFSMTFCHIHNSGTKFLSVWMQPLICCVNVVRHFSNQKYKTTEFLWHSYCDLSAKASMQSSQWNFPQCLPQQSSLSYLL